MYKQNEAFYPKKEVKQVNIIKKVKILRGVFSKFKPVQMRQIAFFAFKNEE